jgi:hypothetical protein
MPSAGFNLGGGGKIMPRSWAQAYEIGEHLWSRGYHDAGDASTGVLWRGTYFCLGEAKMPGNQDEYMRQDTESGWQWEWEHGHSVPARRT